MHPANEEYRIQQQDRQYEERQQLYRPGYDDNLALLEHLAWLKKSKVRWQEHPVNANLRDADEQASHKKWADEYYPATYAMTEEEYAGYWNNSHRKSGYKYLNF